MSAIKTITVMGATGSIGLSTLALVRQFPEKFVVHGLVAGQNVEKLAALAHEFMPKIVGIDDANKLDALRSALSRLPIEIVAGQAACTEIATMPVDMVVAGIVGIAGLPSVLAAVNAQQTVALANKEALVSAGSLVMRQAQHHGAHILPLDSEHNAIFQCWQGWRGHQLHTTANADTTGLSHICLTASGGPFLDTPLDQLAEITPQQAVRHPNWEMGQKISVDSATMMNKGLEVIEAHWLFDLAPTQIEVLIHPQQAVHGMVYFHDGSMVAQLAGADMRTPISYALAWPERLNWTPDHLDLATLQKLEFAAVDEARFRCFHLARQTLTEGGVTSAVLNAANEIAVAAFLQNKIGFLHIAEVVDTVLDQTITGDLNSLEAILAIDAEARHAAADVVTKSQGY